MSYGLPKEAITSVRRRTAGAKAVELEKGIKAKFKCARCGYISTEKKVSSITRANLTQP